MHRYAVPRRVVVQAEGMRVWAHVVQIEPGRVWVFPGEPVLLAVGFEVHLSFWAEDKPRLGMTGEVSWAGPDMIAVDLRNELDLQITARWSRGRTYGLESVAAPRVSVRAA